MLITTMALRQAIQNVLSYDRENVGQGHHLQKMIYLGFYTADFNQTFTKMMLLWLTTKE